MTGISMTPINRILLLALLPVLLIGCASGKAPEEDSAKRVGMHIDAMFEFAVEYPLDWTKTRQQNRIQGWGVVLWTHPDNPEVRLSVHSILAAADNRDLEQRLQQVISERPGFEPTSKEEVDLQGHSALHVTGQTPQLNYDIHVLASSHRLLVISYSAPPALFKENLAVLEEALESFIVLESK